MWRFESSRKRKYISRPSNMDGLRLNVSMDPDTQWWFWWNFSIMIIKHCIFFALLLSGPATFVQSEIGKVLFSFISNGQQKRLSSGKTSRKKVSTDFQIATLICGLIFVNNYLCNLIRIDLVRMLIEKMNQCL